MTVSPWRLLVVATLAWCAVLAVRVAPIPYLWDDTLLLDGGLRGTWSETIRVAWTEDYWSLASPGQRFLSGMYRPVLGTMYAIERVIFGPSPVAGHVVNVALHGLVALGVGRLAIRWGINPLLPGALVLSHPHVTELVGIVTNRTDLVAALLVVASLLVRGLAGELLILAACLSKEVALVGPVLWALSDVRSGAFRPLSAVRSFWPAVVALALRFMFVQSPPMQAAWNPLYAVASTGWTLFDLAVPVVTAVVPPERDLAPGVVLAAIGVALAWRFPRFRVPLAWIAIAWAPTAGWLPVETREGRGLVYLPLVGFALGVGTLVELRPAIERAGAAALVALFLGLQWGTLGHYRDPVEFWTWSLERNPSSSTMQAQLAWHWIGRDERRAREAFRQLRTMEGVSPANYCAASVWLGRFALREGDEAGARKYWQDAVRVGGPYAEEARSILAAFNARFPTPPETPAPPSPPSPE